MNPINQLHTGVDLEESNLDELGMRSRPRRNRQSSFMRSFMRENYLGPEHLVYPLFVHDSENKTPIESMPECNRLSIDQLVAEAECAFEEGIGAVVLFPAIEDKLKSSTAEECHNPEGLIPRTIQALKRALPELCVMTDVALDPYSSDGHDGLVAADGRVLNDETVELLCRQALCHAEAGADMVAPSDMMDGRIGAIRESLDLAGFKEVSILAYTAKYASAYYGPFRDALDSAPKAGDKKTYQMDPANSREALRELELDEEEGADIVMVKPAGAYLDIIQLVRDHSALPVAAYQVSGEYAMIKAACEKGWLDEKAIVLESLLSIRRAGADLIFTYFARQAARWLK